MAALMLAGFYAAAAQTTPGGAEKLPWQTGAPSGAASKPGEQVQFLDPAQVTVQAGKASIIALQFHIADGMHINSHAPHDASLVPTQMLVVDADGLKTQKIDFPIGTDIALSFSPKDKVNVYTGVFSLQAHIVAARGKHEWQGVMRYQACSLNQCMPPNKLPVIVDVIAK
jgi:hypothetical protein